MPFDPVITPMNVGGPNIDYATISMNNIGSDHIQEQQLRKLDGVTESSAAGRMRTAKRMKMESLPPTHSGALAPLMPGVASVINR